MSLIGSVVERTPNATGSTTSMTPFPVSSDPKTGFPAVTHRSQRQRKSAFRQNMEAARPINRDGTIPVVKSFSEVTGTRSGDPSDAPWRSTMEAENARKVALMTEEEREEELRQLSSKFGDIAELRSILGRAKDSRSKADNKETTSPTVEEVSDEDDHKVPPLGALSSPLVHNPQHRVAAPPRPVLSRRSSVSGVSRTGANTPGTPGVRFAQVTPRDVFTYPSAPTSPRRTTLLIEAPPAEGSGENVTKLQWHGKIPPVVEPTKVAPQTSSTESATRAVPEDETKKPEHAHPLSQVVSSSPSSSPPELKSATDLPANSPGQVSKLEADTPTGNATLPRLNPIDTQATPEAIRQQYFPNEPKNNPNLAWMADLPEIPDTPVTSEFAYIDGMGEKFVIREEVGFDLDGTPIPQEIAKEMPANNGLHHNSRGTAGKSESTWVWACKAGVGAVCVGVAAAVSLKAAF
ncbi:unnamed protein product [Rhizoctonia solani]|uniref:Uncharacterized protein n=1 Tax=Rhizoctonia solani TaxID=456999 RepID=A0A8H3B0B8_9AGAM|nr:unnamed protein product [Rhizoctonia solani]